MDFEKMIAYVEENKDEYFAKLLNRGGIGMNNDKIHVLKDESLGGIEREYVEADRKAEVGELVIPYVDSYGTCFSEGKPYEVTFTAYDEEDGKVIVDDNEGDDHRLTLPHYRTLEPTDIVHIDGSRYRMVDRKAEVGETIITVKYAVDDTGIKTGDILTCENEDFFDGSISVAGGEGFFDMEVGDKYYVLEQVDSEPTVTATADNPAEVLDLLANLARRVTEIERVLKTPTPFATQAEITGVSKRLDSVESQLRDTQGNVERLAEEIAAGKPVVINTPNITVNEGADVDRIARELMARIEGACR